MYRHQEKAKESGTLMGCGTSGTMTVASGFGNVCPIGLAVAAHNRPQSSAALRSVHLISTWKIDYLETRSSVFSTQQILIHKHHLQDTLTVSIMTTANHEHTKREWSDLCIKVIGLVPKEIGEEAWYLVIVRKANVETISPLTWGLGSNLGGLSHT